MLPDQVSNPGPLAFESGALPIALCRPAWKLQARQKITENQLLQLCSLVRSDKCTSHMMTNETEKTDTDKNWIDDGALTEIDLSASIAGTVQYGGLPIRLNK